MRTTIRPDTIAPSPAFYAPAVRCGNMIFLAGQIARDLRGGIVGKDDMRAQTRQVLENMKAILEAAGASMHDVVKITMFLTDLSRVSETRDLRIEFFGDHPPAATGVEVKALFLPDAMIEIDAIAVIG